MERIYLQQTEQYCFNLAIGNRVFHDGMEIPSKEFEFVVNMEDFGVLKFHLPYIVETETLFTKIGGIVYRREILFGHCFDEIRMMNGEVKKFRYKNHSGRPEYNFLLDFLESSGMRYSKGDEGLFAKDKKPAVLLDDSGFGHTIWLEVEPIEAAKLFLEGYQLRHIRKNMLEAMAMGRVENDYIFNTICDQIDYTLNSHIKYSKKFFPNIKNEYKKGHREQAVCDLLIFLIKITTRNKRLWKLMEL